MDLIKFLREKLTPNVIEKLSGFLGEPPEKVEMASQAVLPTMLGGLVQQGTTEAGANKIMDIIKEGGHTGDILVDLPGLLDNFDKTQLVVTIGNNIFNHFFGNTTPVLTDKIAGLGGISKSSATSLLGLTAPLVLGTIGHVVNKDNLGVPGLMKLLNEQRENVSKSLPASIALHLPLRTINTAKGEATLDTGVIPPPIQGKVAKSKPSKRTTERDSGSFIDNIFPWLLLILLAAAVAYYLRSCQGVGLSEVDTNQEIADSTQNADTPGILSDTSTFMEDGADEPTTLGEEDEPTNPAVIPPANTETTERDKAEDKAVTTEARQENGRNGTKKRTDTSRSSNRDQPSDDEPGYRAETTPVTASQLNSSNWVTVTSGNFSPNSAEVRDRSATDAIADFLKQNPSSIVVVAPAGVSRLAEDRAYAIREQLIQNGINKTRIIIAPPRGGNGVLVKINQ